MMEARGRRGKGKLNTKKRKRVTIDDSTQSKKKRLQDSTKCQIPALSLEVLAENVKVLGMIKDIRKSKLIVTLPAGFCGIILANNISPEYTDLMNNCLANQSKKELHNLSDMFEIGCLVSCKVMDVNQKETQLPPSKRLKSHDDENKQIRTEISLSINPIDMNDGFKPGKLRGGSVLSASVVSEEDYGYVMNLGIPSLKGFMKKEDAEEYIRERNGRPLLVGTVLRTLVTNVTKSCVHLTCSPKLVTNSKMTKDMKLNIHTILPGMRVLARVTGTCNTGINLNFLGLKGAAHRRHLLEACTSPQKYTVGDEVDAWILYVEPLSKTIYVTLQNYLKFPPPFHLFENVKIGEIIEKAIVTEVSQNSVFLNVRNEYMAICKRRNFPKTLQKIDAHSHQLVGSHQKCRILRLNPMDNLLIVTMKEEHVAANYFTYHSLEVGARMKVNIKNQNDDGLIVEISPWVSGLVPVIHIDKENTNLQGICIKKQIKCRVLTVNPEKKALILTNIKDLVKSEVPPLTTFEDAGAGSCVEGFISSVHPRYVVVSFYNNVKGSISQKDLARSGVIDIEKHFNVGQVVKCEVVSSIPENRRLYLRLQGSVKPSSNNNEVKKQKGEIKKRKKKKLDETA